MNSGEFFLSDEIGSTRKGSKEGKVPVAFFAPARRPMMICALFRGYRIMGGVQSGQEKIPCGVFRFFYSSPEPKNILNKKSADSQMAIKS